MSSHLTSFLLVASVVAANGQSPKPVLNEIFYHAPSGIQDLEWVEIHNPGREPVDISGWELSRGIRFKFPQGTTMSADAYLVVSKDRQVFQRHYSITPFGQFEQSLGDGGDRIDLMDAKGTLMDSVVYKDSAPWPRAADGHSSSLERICPMVSGQSPNNWAASPLSEGFEPAGTPGARNAGYSATLPPVIQRVDFEPKRPRPGGPIRVTALLEDPAVATKVSLHFRTLSPGRLDDETVVEMKRSPAGGYVGEIPGQGDGTFLRFRVAAQGAGGAPRFEPPENELRPAISVYVSGAIPDARIPIARVVNTDPADARAAELDRRKAIRGFGPRGMESREASELEGAIESAFSLADPWFEVTVKGGMDWATARSVRPLLLTKRPRREEIIYSLMIMDDLKKAIEAVPERAKEFREEVANAIRPRMTAEQLDLYRQSPAPAPTVPAWVHGLLDLKGAWFALCDRFELQPQRFPQLTKALRAAQVRWEELQGDWKNVRSRETFTKFRDSVTALRAEFLESVKPALETPEWEFLSRQFEGRSWRNVRGVLSASPSAPRGRSAIVLMDPATKDIELFDFVNIKPRTEGFKVRLPDDQRYRGMSTFNLLFEYQDRFVLAEYLSYDLYRRVGNAASVADFARLSVDGQARGYYLMFEQPNRTFLRRNNVNPDGDLFKIIFFGDSIESVHEKKNHFDRDHRELIALLNRLDQTGGEEEWRVIEKHFNVPQVINYFAVNMVLSHWDGYFNNYFAYHDRKGTGKWEIYPWDQDKTWGFHDSLGEEKIFHDMQLTFGMEGDRSPTGDTQWRGNTWWRPGGYFSKPLLANPEFRSRFLQRLKGILNHEYTEAETFPVIEQLAARLRPEVAVRAAAMGHDAAKDLARFERNIESFKDHLRKRREFLLSQKELKELGTH